MHQQRKDLYIILNQSRAAGRGCLQGILRFAESRPGWRTHLFEPDEHGLGETMRALKNGHADGVLTLELENAGFAACLESSNIPLVVVGSRASCLPRRLENLSIVTIDEEKIGAFAAQQAIHLGNFKSFGYVGCQDEKCGYLSQLRQRGLSHELQRQRHPLALYDPEEDLATWLQRLEKPAAVIGCVDDRGEEVLRACERSGIRVPEDLRVIGIDNSEYICLTSYPTLSSVAVNVIQVGYAAASELDRLLRRRTPAISRKVRICPTHCTFVQRNSTRVLPPGRELVNRAIAYINAHADSGLSVDMVVNHLHISKRLLYLRFSEFVGKSVHRLIVERRIEFLKHKLASSRQSIREVTAACGFENPTHVKTLFKRLTGYTPSAWRKRQNGTFKGSVQAKH